EEIPCNVVGLTAGVSPNIEFITSSKIETNRGVLVNRYLETNIPDVYAIGDCAEQREAIGNRKPIEAVWYTGRMMGEVIAQTICRNKMTYNPGHWFNSAKFFDIEYQTYGWVFAKPKENHAHFHWKHADNTKCITIEYNTITNEFIGINTFGIRMRHETFDTWLTEKRTIDFVINHLSDANFDPEFYKRFENDILATYKNQLQNV
ncbi:FAD-dependent oxidoreductase, partial [Yeosuana marina]|uniref:FAD-dependent oxidoreductase n=1 Tax=Yeosuana marina TaxID=1565536 RepID=UPI0030C8B1EA